mgnify:CR=1 FL=1
MTAWDAVFFVQITGARRRVDVHDTKRGRVSQPLDIELGLHVTFNVQFCPFLMRFYEEIWNVFSGWPGSKSASFLPSREKVVESPVEVSEEANGVEMLSLFQPPICRFCNSGSDESKPPCGKEGTAPLGRVNCCDVLPGANIRFIHLQDGHVVVLWARCLGCGKDETVESGVEVLFHILLNVNSAERMACLRPKQARCNFDALFPIDQFNNSGSIFIVQSGDQ